MACTGATLSALVLSKMARQATEARRVSSDESVDAAKVHSGPEVVGSHQQCEIPPIRMAQQDLTPVFAASYPGSGSSMVRHLIESLMGLATGDEWFKITRRAIALKTHFPHRHGTTFEWSHEIDHALLIMRNPRDAIPSFFNHLYEKENNLTHHTKRAPLDEWIGWRNRKFSEELLLWEDFVRYWVDNFPPDRRLVVTYEGLTKGTTGPGAARSVASFLQRSVTGVRSVVPNGHIPCVWYKVVKYDAAENKQTGKKFGSLRSGKEGRPYTRNQLVHMVTVLSNLRDRYAGTGAEPELTLALEEYIEDIGRNLRVHKEEIDRKIEAKEVMQA